MSESIFIQKHSKPKLKLPEFSVDGMLHKKLQNYELTSLINKSHMACFLGRPGSGKTSLLTSFLKTKDLFRKVFHKIYLFMPSNSRQSIKGGFFDKNLPEEQVFDGLDSYSLGKVYQEIRELAEDNKKTLIIFDDVQKSFKGECEKLLLEMSANRRHLKLSMWMVCQNWLTIPRQTRMNFTNIFAFKVTKAQMKVIFEEMIDLFKGVWEIILNKTYSNPHDFLFIDVPTQRLFFNFDEIILTDEEEIKEKII